MSETRILLRRDSAQNWFEKNPVLSPGEIGYCTDTRQIKIGNGAANWNDLPHTYNPTYEGTKPYSVLLTNHTFTPILTGANAGKTNILVVGLFPAKVPTNVGVSAYLYVSTTGASSRRLLRKVPVTLNGYYSIGIGFTNIAAADMVYLGEYTVEVLGETQELIGKYTFTYRPVLNALKLDMFLETDRRARIHIYNPMTITSGTVVVRRRSDLAQVGAPIAISNIPPVSGASFNTVFYDLNAPVAFVDNSDYFCEINYNTANDLYATSEVVKCSLQKVSAVTFDADENRTMNIQIEDGNLKVQSLSVFPCDSSGSVDTGTTAIGTLLIPGGGLQSENVYTINLSRTLLHEEYYLFQYVYSTEPYNSPPKRFIQLVTLNDITISSDNSITTSIEFEGSGYNVALTAREGSSTGTVLATISGPVSIFKDSIDPIATYNGSVLNPATSFFTPVVYSDPKPFYAIGFSPFLPYEKNGILKVTDANKALMLDALLNALHYSYRLRLYPISDILQLMLETIHTYKATHTELAKIRIYASVSPIYVTEQTPIYNYKWITASSQATLDNLQNRLIKPLLKFGTENIIGVIVGNEDLHRECANPNTSNMRKNYLFNVLVVAINEVREFLLNPEYDSTRIAGTAIKMVPVGISDAPNEIVFNSKFGEARTEALVKLCDFVMLNNHPFYDATEYGDAQQWESNFRSLLTSSTAYIASLSPPDNPCHCIIGEWGWPSGWEWPVIQTNVPTPTPTNMIDYSTTPISLNAKYIGATHPLTPAIQRDWIKRILKTYQSNPTSSGTQRPTMPIDMVYFGFMDNHAESQPLSKGSYVRTWGLCRVDIQTIEGVDNTQAGHNVAPADSTTYVAVDGNEEASSTEIAIYNRRTKITKKHQGINDIATFLTTNEIPLHITNTAKDLIFRTEYPEVTVTTLPSLTEFIAGRSYHFSIKAGGHPNNVRYSIPNQILPYNGDDLYILALRFASFNSIKVVAATNDVLTNVIFDIIDTSNPSVVIGSRTINSAPQGSLITTVPLTSFPIPPAIPPVATDLIPVAPTSISNWSATTSYSVGAKVKVGSLFYNCLYANIDLQPNISIPDFNSVLSYAVGDVVFVSGEGLYRCNTPVTQPVETPTTSEYWDLLIPAFNSGASSYAVGDAVFVKGKGLYRCKTGVTQPVAVPPNQNWEISFPAFSSSVSYAVGNIVFVSGAGLFRCNTGVAASATAPPTSNWDLLFSAFSSAVNYAIGNIVFVPGQGLFRCNTPVSSPVAVPPNSNWDISIPDFKSVATYDVGNIVLVPGEGLYRCKTEVSSPETPPNSNWEFLYSNFRSVLSYAVGNIVFVPGEGLFRCNTPVSSPVPTPLISPNWDLLIPDFNSAEDYAVGDVVFVRGRGLYRCKTGVTQPVVIPPNSNWEISFPDFSSSVNYAVGNIVFVSGAGLFRCKTAVAASAAVPPTGNWDLLFSAFSSAVNYAIGDVVFIKGKGLFRCKKAVSAAAAVPPNSNWDLSFPDFESVVTYNVDDVVFVPGEGSFRCITKVSSPETPPNSNWDPLPPTNDTQQVWKLYDFITARTLVNKPVTLPASSATFFQYGRSYAVKVSYAGGIPFQSDPLVFESQIASFGTDGNNRVKLDLLWFDREPRSLKEIPVSELPDEDVLRATTGNTATPAFFANISSADISLYKYTSTVGGVFSTANSANRLQPSISNYGSVITSDGSTDRIFIMKSDTTGLPITLDNYYGDEIFIRIIYKAEVPAKRLVAETVTEKIKVYQSLTLIGTVKKKVQFEQAAVSKSYINVAQDVIFGTLTINNEDGPDFRYGSTDFIQIVPKLITNAVPPTVLSSTTLNNGKYELITTPLNLVDKTTYAVGFYARRPDSVEVFIASQPITYVNYSDVSFSLVFLTDKRLRVTANFSTYAKKRVKLELYGSSTTSIFQQHISLANQCSSSEFYIPAGNTSGTIELKDPFTFKIGYYYSVKTTIYAYDDESYSDTVVSTTPITNSDANRFIYNTCDFLSPTIDIFSGLVTIRILWSTYSGTPVVAFLNLISDQEVTYARKRITLNATGSNQTYNIALNAADLFSPLVPTDSYYVYLEFETGYITPNSSTFVYDPITLRVLSTTSKTITGNKTTTFDLDWGGPDSSTPAIASVVLKSAPSSAAISTLNITPASPSCALKGNYKAGDVYTFIVKYGTRELVSIDFSYAEITATATDVVFKDDIGDIITDNLGYLSVEIELTGLPTHTTLYFDLYEFTQEGNQLDGIFVNRKPISDARANYSATLTFKTEYFRINKWYNVKYLVNEAGDFLFTNNIQYLPKGYDIIVIAGGSNQVGEDTDTTRGDSAPYTIDRERGGDPQLTTNESTLPLKDKNNKIVKIYNLKATGTYTTNALTNEDVPYLHRAIAPFQQFSSVPPPSGITYGITAGYEFAKYYASSNVLGSNRRVVVINEAIPSSAFATPAIGTGGTVWNPSTENYVPEYYDNVKNSLRNVSIRNTYSNIVPDRNKLTHANVGKSPKLGCKISLSNSMTYSQQIVDNFQYCYFVDDTMLKNIHPIQGNIITGFAGLPTSDTGIRDYIQKELKVLDGGSVSSHSRFPFKTGYTPASGEYNFNAFKNVMNFIVENELTLRINGLVGPDSTVGFWLNGLSRSNAIYAIMRHCYTVVKWFNENYPGIVFAYDVIRNHFITNAPGMGVYANNEYARSDTDTLYTEAAFVGAYAALLETSPTAVLSWSESLVDSISLRYPYKRGSASYGIDQFTITFQNKLAGILNDYVGVGCIFPITGISIQGKYKIGDFILSPTNPFITSMSADKTTFNNTLFNGTSDFNEGTYLTSSRQSLLRVDGDSRYIQGVTLLERITAFSDSPPLSELGYLPLAKTLPVTITETELDVSTARFGDTRTNTATYWAGTTYPQFRILQSQYLRTLHWLLVNSSLNINTDYLGVGELVSNPISQDLSAFFFSGATPPAAITETGVLDDVITYIRTYSLASPDYTANRVVAFLWNQGEANRPAFDNSATYVTYITSFINGLMSNSDIKRARLDDAVYLIGNLSIEHTARQMVLPTPPITSYGIHENIDNYAIVDRKVQPITSLGLHCIDPNIPTSLNTATIPPSFPTISFSARSQRLMGARYFNGYLANTGNTDTATYPIYRSETGHISIPLNYDINLDSKLLTFINESSSYDYTKHPIAYFLQTRFYKTGSTFESTAADRVALITEYSSTNRSSVSDTDPPNLAIVPYFDMSSATIVSENSPISLNTYSVSGNIVSSKLNAVNNVITATYTYDPAVFKKDSGSNNISRIGTKTLTSDLTSYLRTVSNDFTTNPDYLGSASIIGIIKRSILGGSPNFSIVFNNYFRIPPYTFVETPKINTITAIGSSTLEASTNGSDFTLPTSIYVPNVVKSSYVNGIIYVGTHPGQFGSPAPSGVHNTTGTTFPPVAFVSGSQVPITSSTASAGVNRSSYGQDIEGTTRVTGLSATPLAGIFTGEGTWGTAGASSASPTTYTAAGNGRLYTIATKGLDWIMFISRARFYTQRILKDSINYHVLGTLATSIPPITNLAPTFYYPCATAGSQFAGISRIPLSANNKLLPVSGSYTPTFKYFMYLFNAETSIIFRLNNVTLNTTYTLSFYFSVKSGRVPHENGYSSSSDSDLTTTSTIDTGGVGGTAYPALYEIYDPLPINIYYSDPTVGAQRPPNFTYNLNFRSGTNTLTNFFLHTTTAKWDGSWRLVSLTFTPSTAIPAGNCYVQLGPLPYRNMIDTSFNFGGFSTKIVNT